MDLDLINLTSTQIFENFKTEFYNSYGKTLLNGSDDWISAGVITYVLTILVNALNDASNQRFIDTATGGFLDAIGEVNGISRPSPAHASAVFTTTPITLNTAIPVHGLKVSNGSQTFQNEDVIYLENSHPSHLLYCTESGSANNGIPSGTITNIIEGSAYVSSASNFTATSGGDDGYPYTPEGDERFRNYIKNIRSAYVVGGSAPAYRAKALETDNRILDVYIAKDGDSFYEKGKVKIYTLYDLDAIPFAGRQLINNKVKDACNADDFRCIGDYIEVRTASTATLYLSSSNFVVKYPLKFKDSAVSHFNEILREYRHYLYSGFARPISESELGKRFIEPDSNGIYALSVDIKSADGFWFMPPLNAVELLTWEYMNDDPKPSIDTYVNSGLIQLIDTGE